MRLFPKALHHRLALLILLLFSVQVIVTARALPLFEAADEAAHFLYIHNLLEDRELPVIVPRAALSEETDPAQVWAIERHQPPLYYALGALFVSWTQRDDINAYLRPNPMIFTMNIVNYNHNVWLHPPDATDGDTTLAMWVLRLYSLGLGLGSLIFIYRGALLLFNAPWLAVVTLAFVATIPTFVSISGSVNNDNMVTFLYSAGVYGVLYCWYTKTISYGVMLALCVILPAAALAKLTGASLYGVVFVGLLYGVWRGYLPRRAALQTITLTLISGVVLAGWWYVRNWDLYGDPLALAATQSLWGREFETAATSGDLWAELGRIFRTFWMGVGHLHQPVYGPDWVFVYAAGITALGVIGVRPAWKRMNRLQRDSALLLALVCALITGMLLVGTRSVDISYGRLLFPALIGAACLMVMGWAALIGRIGAALLVLPLLVASVIGWTQTLPQAYPRLQVVDALPQNAPFLSISAGELSLPAYRIAQTTVTPGDEISLDVYLRGRSTSNAGLFITAVDSITLESLGSKAVYPGMAPTDVLQPDQLYRARVRVPLDNVQVPLSARTVGLKLSWFSPSLFEDIPLVDGAGNPLESVILEGPVLLDERYTPDVLRTETDIVFGDAVTLDSYTLSRDALQPGETLSLYMEWAMSHTLPDDWTLTVQLIDDVGRLVDQADGPLIGYPSTVWQPDTTRSTVYRLRVPPVANHGDYTVLVGWYRLTDTNFERLTPQGTGEFLSELFVLSRTIRIQPLCTPNRCIVVQ